MHRPSALVAGLILASAVAGGAAAEPLRNGGKLLLTRGVSSIEGAAGGGLATWAVVAGDETADGVGGTLHATYVRVDDYELRTGGVALGLFDKLELSAARQEFDTGGTGAKLGLGSGFTFGQDVYGAKLKLAGDAVFDQDRLMPQVSVGVQHKRNDQGAVVRAVGARDDTGTDVYVSATKIVLDPGLVLNGTVRWTKANQTGLLGFGGLEDDYQPQVEVSAAYMFSKRLVGGVEYRSKPDNLGFAAEDDWFDVFGAVALTPRLSVTAAYVDLGSIATFEGQRGLYLSLQAGF